MRPEGALNPTDTAESAHPAGSFRAVPPTLAALRTLIPRSVGPRSHRIVSSTIGQRCRMHASERLEGNL